MKSDSEGRRFWYMDLTRPSGIYRKATWLAMYTASYSVLVMLGAGAPKKTS